MIQAERVILRALLGGGSVRPHVRGVAWLVRPDGSGARVHERVVRGMVERGWLRQVDHGPNMPDPEWEITDAGRAAARRR